jgi:hypothetical protein
MSRFAVIEPAMKGALNAGLIDDFPSDSQMCAHVEAIGFESIDNSVLPSIKHHILAGNISISHVPFLEEVCLSNVIPAVGIGRRRSSHILPLGIGVILDQKMGSSKPRIVHRINNHRNTKHNHGPEMLIQEEIFQHLAYQLHFKS